MFLMNKMTSYWSIDIISLNRVDLKDDVVVACSDDDLLAVMFSGNMLTAPYLLHRVRHQPLRSQTKYECSVWLW